MKQQITCIILAVTVFSFTLEAVQGRGQADIEALIRATIEERRIPAQDVKTEVKITDEHLKTANPQELLALLANYDKDPSSSVRQLAFLYEVRVATLHPRIEIRQEVVNRLVKALVEPNSNVSPHPYRWLLSFTEGDFDNSTKEIIRNALAKDSPQASVMRICGVANIKEELPRLERFLIDEVAYMNDPSMRHFPKWYYTLGWSARLARARMGVKEDIAKCIELAEAEKDSDERVLRILPDIGYIRQPEAIRYLQKYLESDKRLPSESPDILGEPYASYVMDILIDSLESFPIEKKAGRGYSSDQIKIARKWMSEQSEWKIIR